jgi:hypothetical protein
MQCISSIWDELGRGEYRGHIKVRLCYEFITNEEIRPVILNGNYKVYFKK